MNKPNATTTQRKPTTRRAKSATVKTNRQLADQNLPTAPSEKSNFAPIGSLFESFAIEDKGGYITQEFQDFGYRMAVELDDLAHKSLYMRLSKTVDRSLLERALSFVSDAANAQSKGRLFMWKLQELKKEKKNLQKKP